MRPAVLELDDDEPPVNLEPLPKNVGRLYLRWVRVNYVGQIGSWANHYIDDHGRTLCGHSFVGYHNPARDSEPMCRECESRFLEHSRKSRAGYNHAEGR